MLVIKQKLYRGLHPFPVKVRTHDSFMNDNINLKATRFEISATGSISMCQNKVLLPRGYKNY